MSRCLLIFAVLLAVVAQAQRTRMPSASNPRQPRSAQHSTLPPVVVPSISQNRTPAAEVAPDVTVLAIHGLCPPDAPHADPEKCVTTLTRDQFEDVLAAVSLGGQALSPSAIRSIADMYVQYLVLADAARRTGADKDPRVQELLKVVRLRTLSEAYRRSLEEKYRNPAPEEIEKYYRENIAKYEAAKAERMFIPNYNPRSPRAGAAEFRKKAETLSQETRDRAVKGEALNKLQNEAFLKLGITPPGLVPETGLRRRNTFPPAVVDDVFSLKPGEVSKVESEAGGYAIYRMISRETYSLDQVKGEIIRDIYKARMEAAIKDTLGGVHTEFNNQYFAPAATTVAPGSLPPGSMNPAPGGRVQVLPPRNQAGPR